MTREGWKQTSIPNSLYEELVRFVKSKDNRFPEEATTTELIRSLYRIAKRSPTRLSEDSLAVPPENGRSDPSSSVRSPDTGPVQDRSVHQEKQENPRKLELRQAEAVVLAQKITLERQKQRTEWLKAVRAGKIQPAPKESVSARPIGFLCKLHHTVHSEGPCQEIQEVARDLNISVEEAGKGGFIGQ